MNDHPFKVKFGFPGLFSTFYPAKFYFYRDTMRELVQDTLLMSLGSSAASTPVPFYLTSDPDLSPTNYDVTVQLLFDTIDFLPQVQVGIEVRVRSQKLFPGLYLPVSVGDIEVPGVLLLKESLGERVFRATLYASDTLEKIPVPAALVSTDEWEDVWERDEHHYEQHTIKKVIGSIVELT